MRIYFTDPDIITKITDNSLSAYFTLQSYLINTEIITKIYSVEGIFYVINNVLNRLNIKDSAIAHTTINNINFIVDKSTIEYEPDWTQLNPTHIVETAHVYTYLLQEHVDADADAGAVRLTIEKTPNKSCEVYFTFNDTFNYETLIVTFLSQLNLC